MISMNLNTKSRVSKDLSERESCSKSNEWRKFPSDVAPSLFLRSGTMNSFMYRFVLHSMLIVSLSFYGTMLFPSNSMPSMNA